MGTRRGREEGREGRREEEVLSIIFLGLVYVAHFYTASAVADCKTRLQDIWYKITSLLPSLFSSLSSLFSPSELSHALYQHDAACRVIARLTKEVNGAREGPSLFITFLVFIIVIIISSCYSEASGSCLHATRSY